METEHGKAEKWKRRGKGKSGKVKVESGKNGKVESESGNVEKRKRGQVTIENGKWKSGNVDFPTCPLVHFSAFPFLGGGDFRANRKIPSSLP